MTHIILLYTALKQVDLFCLSAKEAILHQMKLSSLHNLHRFKRYSITIESESKTSAKEKLQKILDTSFYFMNPNKELYFKDAIQDAATTFYHVLVDISQTIPSTHRSLVATLN